MKKKSDMVTLATIIRAFFAVIIIIVITAGSVFAQGQRQRMSPEEMQKRFDDQTLKMMTALELTDEQKPLFMEIMEAGNADRIDIIEDVQAGGDRSAVRDKMVALNATTTEALSAVLTDVQLEKYNSILAERRQQGRRRGSSGS